MVRFLVGISTVKVFNVFPEVSLHHWQLSASLIQLVKFEQEAQSLSKAFYFNAKF